MLFEIKNIWFTVSVLLTVALLNGCTADYDTFGTSDYCDFNELTLAEQDASPMVNAAGHRMEFDLVAPPESLETWNSVTVDAIDMSHFASLHLVKGKIEEFPTDSVALNSLAQKISLSDEALKMGDKIDIPSNHVVYVVIISESGKKAIWQLTFDIPNVKPKSSSRNSVKSSSSAKSSSSVQSSSSVKSCSSVESSSSAKSATPAAEIL